jgi:hypothetical protein
VKRAPGMTPRLILIAIAVVATLGGAIVLTSRTPSPGRSPTPRLIYLPNDVTPTDALCSELGALVFADRSSPYDPKEGVEAALSTRAVVLRFDVVGNLNEEVELGQGFVASASRGGRTTFAIQVEDPAREDERVVLWRSGDFGHSWGPQNSPERVVDAIFAPDGSGFLCSRNSVFRTSDGGRTWSEPVAIPGTLMRPGYGPRPTLDATGSLWIVPYEGYNAPISSRRVLRIDQGLAVHKVWDASRQLGWVVAVKDSVLAITQDDATGAVIAQPPSLLGVGNWRLDDRSLFGLLIEAIQTSGDHVAVVATGIGWSPKHFLDGATRSLQVSQNGGRTWSPSHSLSPVRQPRVCVHPNGEIWIFSAAR